MKGSAKSKKPGAKKLKALSNASSHRTKVSRASVNNDDTNISPLTLDYKQLFEKSPDAIATIDLKGIITSLNPATLSLTGLSRDELKGKHFSKVSSVQPQDLPKFSKMLVSLIKGKVPKPFEISFWHKDGSIRWGEVSVGLIKDNGRIAGIQAVIRNITEHKQAEATLQVSEANYRNLADSITDIFFAMDKDLKYTYWNKASEELIGISAKDAIGKSIQEIFPDSECRRKAERMYREVLRTGQPQVLTNETQLGSKNYFFEISAYPSSDGLVVFARDITQRKQLEADLKDREIRFRELFQNMSSGVAIYEATANGEDFIFKDFNSAAEKMGNIKKEDIIGKSVLKVFPGVKEFGLFDIFQRVWRSGKAEHFPVAQYRDQRISGWRENYVHKLPSGEIVAIYDDITERKRTEDELKKSEEKYRNLVERANDGICIIQDKLIKYVNSQLINMWGGTSAEIIDTPFTNYVHPDELPKVVDRYNRRMAGEQVPSLYDTVLRHKDGSKADMQLNVGIIEHQGKPAELVIIRDLTEHKRAEQALQESETRFRKIFDDSPLGIALSMPDYRFFMVNQSFCQMLGYNADEFIGRTFADITHPDHTEKDRANIKKLSLREIAYYKTEKRYIKKNKEILWAFTTVIGIYDDNGNIQYYLAMVDDISDRITYEIALRKNEQRLKEAEKLGRIGNWEFDIATQKIEWSDEVYRLYQRSKALGPPTAEEEALYYSPGEANRLREFARLAIEKGKGQKYDLTANLPSGGVAFFYCTMQPIKDDQGQVIKLFGTVQDITERKRMESQLLHSETLLQEAQHVAHIGHWELSDMKGSPTWSEEIFHIFGLDPTAGELSFPAHREIIHPDDLKILNNAVAAALNEGKSFNIEFRFLRPDRSIGWMNAIGNAVKNQNGSIAKIFGTAQDITERKQSEEALRQSEQKYQDVIEGTRAGIVSVDIAGKLIFVNKSICDMVGYPKKHLLGKPFIDFVHLDDKESVKQLFFNAFVNPKGRVDMETRVINRDGEVIYIQAYVSHMKADDKTIGFNAVITDITEHKQTESELRESYQQFRDLSARLQYLREQERTSLAREIHDELGQALTALKMDLSWLSSRLPKENETLLSKAESMRQVIDSTTETVRRMSTELRPGLLDDLGLISAMEWQTAEFTKRTGIKCKLVCKPEEIALELDIATAFFRIFQEVLTNVARHSQATKVTASFKEKAGILELMVSDNGRGITQKEVSSSKSLGLTGMRERAYSFGGKIEIKGKPGKGTTVKVHIARSQPDDKDISG